MQTWKKLGIKISAFALSITAVSPVAASSYAGGTGSHPTLERAVAVPAVPVGVRLPDSLPYPAVIYPLTVPAIQIQGPDRLWGMRIFAREVREQINVKIDVRGYCWERPNRVCIHIKIANYGSPGWCGLTSFRSPRYIVIKLNTNYWHCGGWPRRRTAAHEFGHAIGLSHHQRYGVCGEKGYGATHLSLAELYVLRRYYGR